MLTSAVRREWSEYRCKLGKMIDPKWTLGRKPIYLQVKFHDAGAAFFTALLSSGYELEPTWPDAGFIGSYRRCPAGIGGHDCQEDGSWCSLHNYCLAIDLEYDRNPHLRVKRPDPAWMFARCKLNRSNVEAIESIRTMNGHQVWRWLGWTIGDTMHFQGNVTQDDVATGIDWSSVLGWDGEPPTPPSEEDDEMFVEYRDGFGTDGDEMVRYWQLKLMALGQDTGGSDGKYGDKTKAAVVAVVSGSDGMQIHAVEAVGIDSAFVRSMTTVGQHEHDDRYAKLGHIHDERYSRTGHVHQLTGRTVG